MPGCPLHQRIVKREPLAELPDPPSHALPHRLVLGRAEDLGDEVAHPLHLGLLRASGGEGRGADANAGGDHRGVRVVGDGVLVDRDVRGVERLLRHLASQPRGPHSVLCVVVVTKWQWGMGDGWSPAATSPAMWAMSAISSAPAWSAMARKRAKSITRL